MTSAYTAIPLLGARVPSPRNSRLQISPFQTGVRAPRLHLLVMWVFCWLFIPFAALAEPMARASIEAETTSPYANQRFSLTLTLEYRDVSLEPNFEIFGLPESTTLDTGPGEELPSDTREEGGVVFERRRFRWSARAAQPGLIQMTPTLRVTTLSRQNSFLGFSTVASRHDISIPPVDIEVRPLPSPGPDSIFSGAVGNFEFLARPLETHIVLGDLVTLHMELVGTGTSSNASPPHVLPRDGVKVYPAEQIDSPNGTAWRQTLVPQSAVTELAMVAFCHFDPASAQYVTNTHGPFSLSYHERAARNETQYIPQSTGSNAMAGAANESVTQPRFRPPAKRLVLSTATAARLAPNATALQLFELPSNTTVRVIRSMDAWNLVESGDRRGWIPGQ